MVQIRESLPSFHEFNFVHFLVPDETVEEMFGPFDENDVTIKFEEPFTLADCVVEMGIFPSKTRARQNGWGGEIDRGFNAYKIGKRRFWTYWPKLWPTVE